MSKPNIRSFRFSDEIFCVLQSQPGDTLSAKFETLVKTCFCELEQRQKALDQINAQIEERRDKLRSLEKATEELTMMEMDLRNAKYYFKIVERRAKSISEKEL